MKITQLYKWIMDTLNSEKTDSVIIGNKKIIIKNRPLTEYERIKKHREKLKKSKNN